MRFQGTITKWKDKEGYGFITPRGGGKQVFLHAREFEPNQARPAGQEIVTYEVSLDDQKRERAASVRYVGGEERSTGVGKAILLPLLVALIVFGVLFALSGFGKLNFLVPLFCLTASLVAYVLYAYDKSQSQAKEWRISESSLHLVSLMGGWPGALIAQHQFRHKLRKPGFMAAFWLMAIVNCLAVAAYAIAGN